MAKFYGKIGYGLTVETAPGVWVDSIVERSYTGDIIKDVWRWREYGKTVPAVNADLAISEVISIVADKFVLENMHAMKYVKWRGAAWTINNVTNERPRMILTLGGLFNGNTTPTPDVVGDDSGDETGVLPTP